MPFNMKEKIAETFTEMAKQKNPDKITVKDLVEACGISRQTFYYHFQDILEVLELIVQQNLKKTLEQSMIAETPEEAIKAFISMAVNGYDTLQKLRNSQKRDYIERILLDSLNSYFHEMIKHRAPDLSVNLADAEIAMCFYSSAVAGVLLQYGGKKDLDIDRLSSQLYKLLRGDYMKDVGQN